METVPSAPKSPLRFKTVLLIVLIAVAATLITLWLATRYFFPSQFKPVELSHKEQQVLDGKIEALDTFTVSGQRSPGTGPEPEKYSEDPSKRQVEFTERELNALLARNTDLAEKLAVDLSDNLASARLILPLDPDLPLFGGKTLKLNAGLELRYTDGNPVVVLRGLSLWGVPMPNAWLGGLKNVDLVQEFGGSRGFWQAFSAGIEYVEVKEGKLEIRLKE
ncbi:MAG: arginine N-succinyltransferase [Pseudomonadales bacterium]